MTLAALLALASTGAVAFLAGVVVGRIFATGEPPLREAPRPAEACVEEWTAEDVARFPEARARAYADLAFLDGDDEAPARKPWIVPWTDIEATWDGDEP